MVDLEQLQKDLNNGVIISRSTWAELVKYAAMLEEQRNQFVDVVVGIEPTYMQEYDARMNNVIEWHQCVFCDEKSGMVKRDGRWMKGPFSHKPDCPCAIGKQINKERANEQK